MNKNDFVRFNILVIRLSSMGDILLTTPLIRQLRIKYHQARIDFICSKQFSDIYKNNPHISNLLDYDKSLTSAEINNFKKSILMNLGSKKYDIVIDLQKNFRSLNFKRGLGYNYFSVKKHRLNKLSLVYFKKPLEKKFMNMSEIYRHCVQCLNIPDDGKGLEIWLSGENTEIIYPPEKRAETTGLKKIAIAPGARHLTKRWLPERFAELIDLLKNSYGSEIVIVGGNDDIPTVNEILSLTKSEVSNFSGSSSILKTAEIIDSCNLLITNDTGVMHIAAARQVPVIAIFGSTVQDFGFSPFRVRNKVVEKDVSCRPCSHIGRESCPKGHFNCMKKITVEDVIKAINNLLKV